MKITNYQKGLLFTFLGATFWGLSGVLGEYLLNVSKINSTWVISNRLFYAGFIIILYLYIKEKNAIFQILKNKKDLFKLINFSFLGIGLCQATFFLAIKYTNAGTAAVMQYTGPTMIMIYYCFLKRRLPFSNEFLAIVFSFLGTFIIATHFNISNLIISNEGLFWGISSAITLATYNILSLFLISKYGTLIVVGWGMFFSGITIQIATNSFYIPNNFSIVDFLCMFGVIIIGTILSFSIYLQGVQYIGAVKGSVIACFEPIAAILFSFIFIGTKFHFYDLIGTIIILFSVIVLNKK